MSKSWLTPKSPSCSGCGSKLVAIKRGRQNLPGWGEERGTFPQGGATPHPINLKTAWPEKERDERLYQGETCKLKKNVRPAGLKGEKGPPDKITGLRKRIA